jgi:hypothetical protein
MEIVIRHELIVMLNGWKYCAKAANAQCAAIEFVTPGGFATTLDETKGIVCISKPVAGNRNP